MNLDPQGPVMVACRFSWRSRLRVVTLLFVMTLFVSTAVWLCLARKPGNTCGFHAKKDAEITYHPVNWTGVRQDLRLALTRGEEETRSEVERNVGTILGDIRRRLVPFLHQHYSFIARQIHGVTALALQVGYWMSITGTDAHEHQRHQLCEGLAREVIHPEETSLALEDTLRLAMMRYLNKITGAMESIRLRYQVPALDWDRFLEDLSHIEMRWADAGTLSLPMKTLFTAAGASAGFAILKLQPVVTRSLAGTLPVLAPEGGIVAGESIFLHTGGRFGVKAFGGLVSACVILWEIWEQRQFTLDVIPRMAEEFNRYIDQVRMSILYDPANGICTCIRNWTAQAVAQIERYQARPLPDAGQTLEVELRSY